MRKLSGGLTSAGPPHARSPDLPHRVRLHGLAGLVCRVEHRALRAYLQWQADARIAVRLDGNRRAPAQDANGRTGQPRAGRGRRRRVHECTGHGTVPGTRCSCLLRRLLPLPDRPANLPLHAARARGPGGRPWRPGARIHGRPAGRPSERPRFLEGSARGFLGPGQADGRADRPLRRGDTARRCRRHWREQQTVVLMSYLLSAVGGGQIPALLDSAWKALAPGGRLIIHDFMLHEDREGPLSAALFFLSYLALRTDPISFTAGELKPLLAARGFTHISSGEMIPEITGFILAQKV